MKAGVQDEISARIPGAHADMNLSKKKSFMRKLKMQSADAKIALLAIVVPSSDDAITTKTLDGTRTSWDRGAERIYGHAAGEIVDRAQPMAAT